jgi:predicted O-methyltransferase YrrM
MCSSSNVLEIGFNAGFSTLLMLNANDTINITCVDICEHKYTQPCYNKIKEMYGERVNLIIGSSVIVLPKLIKNTYDLIHIDGCHSVEIAEMDINNSMKLCKSKTILIMDDTDLNHLNNLWKKNVIKHRLLGFTNSFVKTNYHDIKMCP